MRAHGTWAVGIVALFSLVGCGGATPPFPVPAPSLPPRFSAAIAPAEHRAEQPSEEVAQSEPIAQAAAVVTAQQGDAGDAHAEAKTTPVLHLDRDAPAIVLAPGRSVVDVWIPAGGHVSVGVFGPAGALLGFDVIAGGSLGMLRAHGALDEDGMLPRIVSFRAPVDDRPLTIVVDVSVPVELRRIAVDPAAPEWQDEVFKGPTVRRKQQRTLPLVGLPVPQGRDDGYLLQSPGRYQFLRLDIATLLLSALRQTRVRFRRDPIAIVDISQWDGNRPASDLGQPRHISHVGGRDVDIALPADDGDPSTVRPHCKGVLVEADVHGCAPGTVSGFDALRLAYLVGLLFGGGPELTIERVFTDAVYVAEMRRAAEVLRQRRWIEPEAFDGLFDDNIVRASPWHTDHIHVRFSGLPGQSQW